MGVEGHPGGLLSGVEASISTRKLAFPSSSDIVYYVGARLRRRGSPFPTPSTDIPLDPSHQVTWRLWQRPGPSFRLRHAFIHGYLPPQWSQGLRFPVNPSHSAIPEEGQDPTTQ